MTILYSPFFITACEARYFASLGDFVIAMVVVKECSGKVLHSPSVPGLGAVWVVIL